MGSELFQGLFGKQFVLLNPTRPQRLGFNKSCPEKRGPSSRLCSKTTSFSFPAMKLFFKRTHCAYLSSSPNLRNPLPKETQILRFCRSGALSEAFRLLNSIDSGELTRKSAIYASLLQTCAKVACFSNGLQIHGRVIKSGLESDRFVGNSLLTLYFKLGPDFSETQKVFDCSFSKDLVSWTSMISGYNRAGKVGNSIDLFIEMMRLGVEPNGFTLSALIKACSELGDVKLGRSFHGVVTKLGFDSDKFICSALIDMYGRSCRSEDARKVFEEMPEPDAISCTSVISALTRSGSFEEALRMFRSRQRRYNLAGDDGFALGTVLTACGNSRRLKQGKEVHGKVVTSGHCGNVVVESSLVDMYGKCGLADESQRVFDTMLVKNHVSHSAMMGAYCENGDFGYAIEIFREIGDADLYSFGIVLRACAGLAAVRQGREVHCQYVRRGGRRDIVVESALVDLYAKCGCVELARRVFVDMPERNLVTWNSMIHGFAQNWRGEEAIQLFNEMVGRGIEPDRVSFIGVLSGCSRTGLVDRGRRYFESMTVRYGIQAGTEHYSCMVDLLGRAGLLEEAESLIADGGFGDDPSLWSALLSVCTTSTADSAIAERVAKKMIELVPEHHLSYVLLANVYSSVGRWNDALNVRVLMKRRGITKVPGKSRV